MSVLFSFSETSGHLGSGQWHQWNETRASGHAIREEGTCTYTCTDEVMSALLVNNVDMFIDISVVH